MYSCCRFFQAIDIKADHIKCLDCLNIGKCFLIKSVKFRTHLCAPLVVVRHPAQQRAGQKRTERDAKQCKNSKGGIIMYHNRQCTDKFHSIDHKVRQPVQDTTGNI